MPKVIGVKFRNAGKVYYFDPGELPIKYNDNVIVDTSRGIEFGTVVLSPTMIEKDQVPEGLRPVIRLATEEDRAKAAENREKEKEARKVCRQKIQERGLDMKLIDAEYTFDGTKLLFYFTAEGRIDFRELVKDLAGAFRTRIELRQIGVRDETKLLGGIGSCGRPLCCHTWLSEFAPVSIKMAKDQNLSLNPAKISGTCGRLMCCLKNEADTYAYLNKGLPGKGDLATTPDGRSGDVQSVNILRQTVRIIVDMDNDEKELQEYDVKDITFIPKSKRNKGQNAQKEQGQKDRNESPDGRPEGGERSKKKGGKKKSGKQGDEAAAAKGDAPKADKEAHADGGRNSEGGRDHESGKRHEGGKNTEGGRNPEGGRNSEGGKNPEGGKNSEGGRNPEGRPRKRRRGHSRGNGDRQRGEGSEAKGQDRPRGGEGRGPERSGGNEVRERAARPDTEANA